MYTVASTSPLVALTSSRRTPVILESITEEVIVTLDTTAKPEEADGPVPLAAISVFVAR